MVTFFLTVATSSRAMPCERGLAEHLDGAVVDLQRVVERELVFGQLQSSRRARSAARMSLASSISSSMTLAVSIARFW